MYFDFQDHIKKNDTPTSDYLLAEDLRVSPASEASSNKGSMSGTTTHCHHILARNNIIKCEARVEVVMQPEERAGKLSS